MNLDLDQLQMMESEESVGLDVDGCSMTCSWTCTWTSIFTIR